MSSLRLILIFSIISIISRVSAIGDTLVLLDNLAIKETHSIFLKGLQGKKKKTLKIKTTPNTICSSDDDV